MVFLSFPTPKKGMCLALRKSHPPNRKPHFLSAWIRQPRTGLLKVLPTEPRRSPKPPFPFVAKGDQPKTPKTSKKKITQTTRFLSCALLPFLLGGFVPLPFFEPLKSGAPSNPSSVFCSPPPRFCFFLLFLLFLLSGEALVTAPPQKKNPKDASTGMKLLAAFWAHGLASKARGFGSRARARGRFWVGVGGSVGSRVEIWSWSWDWCFPIFR